MLKVNVDGIGHVQGRLSGMRMALGDLEPVMERVAENLREHAELMFDTRGAHGGAPWQGTAGLVRTGKLRRSWTQPGSDRHVEEIRIDGLRWGSSHPLAHLHEKGVIARSHASGKWTGSLPRREVIAFASDEQYDSIFVQPFRDHLGRAA